MSRGSTSGAAPQLLSPVSTRLARAGTALRHHWPAALVAMAGLVATALVARVMEQWARTRDTERFTAECQLVAGMIEQKMERYESVLGRLLDACARYQGEISPENWSGLIGHILGITHNYPNFVALVVGPRVTRSEREAFEQRMAKDLPSFNFATTHPDSEFWVPVLRRWTRAGLDVPKPGADLLSESAGQPSFTPALDSVLGWISPKPVRMPSSNGGAEETGFWYVLPLRTTEFTNQIRWQYPYETNDDAVRRRSAKRAQYTTGLLGAFIGGDRFLDQFNVTNAQLQVQLFTGKEPHPEILLNPGHPVPDRSQFRREVKMRWYGRTWTARFSSTPIFESGSLRYRVWLVWAIGATLSGGAATALAWQTRSRWREAALSEKLRQSLARQEQISRDLHDGTLQSVYAIGLGLRRAQRLLSSRPDDAVTQLTDTTAALQHVIDELRAVIRQTDPTAREEVSLGKALASVVAHLEHATEIQLELHVRPGADEGLTSAQSLQLLNVAREALSNSIRHSSAKHVSIRLGPTEDQHGVRLEVADDGCGFDPATASEKGQGLANLRGRVRELNGQLNLDSSPGRGTRIVIEVPRLSGKPPSKIP